MPNFLNVRNDRKPTHQKTLDSLEPMDIYIALVHHPVKNRMDETVTTSVTNLDIHDLARAACTYGVRGTWIVTPIEQQCSLVGRIVDHWQHGDGAAFNKLRAKAFETVHVASSIAEVVSTLSTESGGPPELVATGAQLEERTIKYRDLRRKIVQDTGTLLILFGTGWGLTKDAYDACDLRLPAIRAMEGRSTYNHLSVRSAVSIILDRLLGAH
jgi:hypothetical protein